MIILISTDDQIEALLGENATTELPIEVSYVTIASSVYTPTNFTATTNDTTAVALIAAPSANNYVQVKSIKIYNVDNITHTVIVRKKVGGVSKVLVRSTLAVNEVLQYIDSEGFTIVTNDGAVEQSHAQNFAISAGTNSYSSGEISFANSNNVSFGITNNSQLTASWYANTVSFWEPAAKNMNIFSVPSDTALTVYNLSFQRLFIPYFLSATRMDFLAHMSNAGFTAGSYSVWVALYGTSANSNLRLLSSTLHNVAWNSGGATSNTNSYSGQAGTRLRTIDLGTWNITPGEYWLANAWSISGVVGTTATISIWGQSSLPIQGMPGGDNDVVGLNGVYSTTFAGVYPNTIGLSDIRFCHSSSNSNIVSYVYRQPHFMLYGTF